MRRTLRDPTDPKRTYRVRYALTLLRSLSSLMLSVAFLMFGNSIFTTLLALRAKIEGYPNESFIEKVIEVKPDQVTLVPDPPDVLTSSFGWDCFTHREFLYNIVKIFQSNNIRVSLFISPSLNTLENLEYILPNRIELYTFDFANNFKHNKEESILPYLKIVDFIDKHCSTIDLNAGHDLSLDNLSFFLSKIPSIKEVSIGHAIVCDAIELGIEKTIKKYLEISSKS